MTNAQELFADTDVHIIIQGKRHLGAAIGSRTLTEEYVCNKVQTWSDKIKRLSKVATSQPHAAYAAFTHGLSSCRSYLLRTIPDVQDLLSPLENETFTPALTGRPPCSKLERDLLGLPVRLGGMGLTNPVTLSTNAFHGSQRLTITQEINQVADPDLTRSMKNSIHRENRQHQDQQAKDIHAQLTPQLKHCVDLAVEKDPHPGLRLSHSPTMASFFTRENSKTPSASESPGRLPWSRTGKEKGVWRTCAQS